MIFYKILLEDKFVGIATDSNLLKFQKRHFILEDATIQDAQYIWCNEGLYHSEWMKKPESTIYEYQEAIVVSIQEDEYNELSDAIERNEEIKVASESEEEAVFVEEELPVQEELTIEFIRETKIREMSLACNKAIMIGFDIELSDGKNHHFSMSMQDQMNMLTITARILQGETKIAYHADGEEMITYSVDEMMKIISGANAHKEYHLAYFNSMKSWINSLKRITSVSDIEYGNEIPKKYQTAFLKSVSQ